MGLVSAALMLSLSCGPSYYDTHKVRDIDLDAWIGAPLIELEVHGMFAQMPRKVQVLSNGDEMWIYSACRRWRSDMRCVGMAATSWAVMNCNGGEVGETCCHNQFYVQTKSKTVAWFRPHGACFTDCDVRPASMRCTDAK